MPANPASVSRQVASGSAWCASKPAESSTSCGSHARTSGATTCSTSEPCTASPDPPGTGRFTVNPSPAPEPRSSAGPVPGYSGHSWIEQNSTDGSAWKMSFVPLPWCTSQSRISTRSAPCSARACAAATATLLKKQNPIARAASAWCPGGRSADTPHGSPSRSKASTIATAPPAERSAAS